MKSSQHGQRLCGARYVVRCPVVQLVVDVGFLFLVFFICFRETLETGIIVSVLLSFLKQALGPDRDPTVYKKLVRQVSRTLESNA